MINQITYTGMIEHRESILFTAREIVSNNVHNIVREGAIWSPGSHAPFKGTLRQIWKDEIENDQT